MISIPGWIGYRALAPPKKAIDESEGMNDPMILAFVSSKENSFCGGNKAAMVAARKIVGSCWFVDVLRLV